jgi:ankyrin repeat protein
MVRRFIGAAAENNIELLSRIIATGFDINSRDEEGGFTALMAASLFDCLSAVELLLQSRADPNIRDYSGMVALDYAVNDSHYGIVERLISDPRFDRNTRDHQGHTILVNAVITGNVEVIKLLLVNGFDPNAACPVAVNPLRYALRKGNLEVIELLVRFGAK